VSHEMMNSGGINLVAIARVEGVATGR